MLNSHIECIKKRVKIVRFLSLSPTQTAIVKRLDKLRQRKSAFRFDLHEQALGRMPLLVHVFAGMSSPAHDQIVFHERFKIYTGTCGRANTI